MSLEAPMATHSFAAADVFRPYYGLISAAQQPHTFLKKKILNFTTTTHPKSKPPLVLLTVDHLK